MATATATARTPRRIPGLLAAGLAVTLVLSTARAQDPDPQDDAAAAELRELRAEVQRLRARIAELERALAERMAQDNPEQLPGRPLSFSVGGRVTDLPRPGHVVQGHIIARLDSQDAVNEVSQTELKALQQHQVVLQQEAALAAAEAAAQAATDRANAAATEHDRIRSLVENGAASRKDLDAAIARLSAARNAAAQAAAGTDAARAGVEAARAGLDALQQALGAAARRVGAHSLWAPESGFILKVLVTPGSYVAAGQPVVIFGDKPMRGPRGPDRIVQAADTLLSAPSFWRPLAVSGQDDLAGVFEIHDVFVMLLRIGPADAANELERHVRMMVDATETDRAQREVNQVRIQRVSLAGSFAPKGRDSREQPPAPGYGMLVATLVHGENGLLIRALGPANRVAAESDDIIAFIESARPVRRR